MTGLCLLTNVDFLGGDVDRRELVVEVAQVNAGLADLAVACNQEPFI